MCVLGALCIMLPQLLLPTHISLCLWCWLLSQAVFFHVGDKIRGEGSSLFDLLGKKGLILGDSLLCCLVLIIC